MASTIETNHPFSVWGFHSEAVEDGVIVTWKEELEDGTRDIRIIVRTEEEFGKAVDRFTIAVRKTWAVWLNPRSSNAG